MTARGRGQVGLGAGTGPSRNYAEIIFFSSQSGLVRTLQSFLSSALGGLWPLCILRISPLVICNYPVATHLISSSRKEN